MEPLHVPGVGQAIPEQVEAQVGVGSDEIVFAHDAVRPLVDFPGVVDGEDDMPRLKPGEPQREQIIRQGHILHWIPPGS